SQAAKRSAKSSRNGQARGSDAVPPPLDSSLPEVTLPCGDIPITATAATLGSLIAQTGRYFRRGDTVALLSREENDDPILRTIKAASLPTAFESVASL